VPALVTPPTSPSSRAHPRALVAVVVLSILIAIGSTLTRLLRDLGWVTPVASWVGLIVTVLLAAGGLFGMEPSDG
jgi:hypothetical protein